MALMVAFSAFGSTDFHRSFAASMWIVIMFCIVVASLRREPAFGGTLNHWDEAVTYAAALALPAALTTRILFASVAIIPLPL